MFQQCCSSPHNYICSVLGINAEYHSMALFRIQPIIHYFGWILQSLVFRKIRSSSKSVKCYIKNSSHFFIHLHVFIWHMLLFNKEKNAPTGQKKQV